MGYVIEVENLRYSYPGAASPAVAGMSFTVDQGEVFGFLGPSGAGKTTAQKIITRLLHGSEGRVDVLGRPIGDWGSELYDRIGIAFELPVGYPRLTVREDLEHFSHLHGVALDPGEVLGRVGLAGAADQAVASLSKGMRIRLNLARALLHEPDLLFLDEPTSGLDPVNARHIRQIILGQRDAGRSVFLTTHDMTTAAEVCDRVAFVVDGAIVACDSPRAFALARGRRNVNVEYRQDGVIESASFVLGQPADDLIALLQSDRIQTMHTEEASLDDVFVSVTGRNL